LVQLDFEAFGRGRHRDRPSVRRILPRTPPGAARVAICYYHATFLMRFRAMERPYASISVCLHPYSSNHQHSGRGYRAN
jgi:hypothetical protein